MNSIRLFPLPWKAVYCIGLALFLAGAAHAQMRVEIQLVWGTDDTYIGKYHTIDTDLAKRFANAPFRWRNYYEVNRQRIVIAVGETKKHVVMSDRCALDIKNLGNNWVTVTLHGDGKPVSTHHESLANNHMLVLSGNAENRTAWLVTIKKVEPPVASK